MPPRTTRFLKRIHDKLHASCETFHHSPTEHFDLQQFAFRIPQTAVLPKGKQVKSLNLGQKRIFESGEGLATFLAAKASGIRVFSYRPV